MKIYSNDSWWPGFTDKPPFPEGEGLEVPWWQWHLAQGAYRLYWYFTSRWDRQLNIKAKDDPLTQSGE